MSIAKFQVSGMTCGGCVNRVKTTLSQFAEKVEVTLDPAEAVLTNSSLDIAALNTALANVGHYMLSAIQTEPIVDHVTAMEKSWLATYKPLLLVFGYILLVTFAIEFVNGQFVLHRWMPNFMAGFFLVFSFFKLLDLKGFASSYAMYDLLAKRFTLYAYLYPFIELGLGVAILLGWHAYFTNLLTFFVMGFSSIGVILAVLNRQKIRCACLGAVFNLPMSTVTIIEDLLMAAMAAWMLI
ncbi:MAG: heavy-metal-associated domain-containing protein [Methylophilaceae bacterium]